MTEEEMMAQALRASARHGRDRPPRRRRKGVRRRRRTRRPWPTCALDATQPEDEGGAEMTGLTAKAGHGGRRFYI